MYVEFVLLDAHHYVCLSIVFVIQEQLNSLALDAKLQLLVSVFVKTSAEQVSTIAMVTVMITSGVVSSTVCSEVVICDTSHYLNSCNLTASTSIGLVGM